MAAGVALHPGRFAQVHDQQETSGIFRKASIVGRFAFEVSGASKTVNVVLGDWNSWKIVLVTVNESLTTTTSFHSRR